MKELLKNLRIELHQNPEIAFNEIKTQKIIIEFLNKNIRNKSFFQIKTPFETSVLVVYKNNPQSDDFLLFRSDMDALPINEFSQNPIVSKNKGMMHACGHDIHMTVLSGFILEVDKDLPKKNIVFLFQPAEEGAGGAKKILDSGVLDEYDIKNAFALHVNDDFPLGSVATNPSILFAIPKEINVSFFGKSAHAAFPEKGNDAILASADFLNSINTVFSKKANPVEPLLIHFGKIGGGDARNIVANEVVLEGTLRAVSNLTMDFAKKELENVANLSAQKFGCTTKIKILGEFSAVINDKNLYDFFKIQCENEKINFIESPLKLTGEDFGFFSEKYPSLMFWLGTNETNKEPISLHSEKYFPNVESVFWGIKAMQLFLKIS